MINLDKHNTLYSGLHVQKTDNFCFNPMSSIKNTGGMKTDAKWLQKLTFEIKWNIPTTKIVKHVNCFTFLILAYFFSIQKKHLKKMCIFLMHVIWLLSYTNHTQKFCLWRLRRTNKCYLNFVLEKQAEPDILFFSSQINRLTLTLHWLLVLKPLLFFLNFICVYTTL